MLFACLMLVFLATVAACPNGCSSRGLCVNGVCQCAEGLSGDDCSMASPSSVPSPYACPTCYDIVVGPAMYYYGPSWRLPDSPIVGLNLNGNLSIYSGNGDAEMLARGIDIEDWTISPDVALAAGNDFDDCGAWLMRAFSEGGIVRGFYHAEAFCDYDNNGQTRKSGAYCESTDGGITFDKVNYPNNQILETDTPILIGQATGEGDFGVVVKDGYYYMFFSNVDDNSLGVARALVTSGGGPGAWYKYYDGNWNQRALGGLSAPLIELTGTQTYLHTPSNSFLSVGNRDAYYQTGTALGASDDGITWNFVSDPLLGGDFAMTRDTILYQSLLGKTGGYDVGSQFDLFYLWVPPGETYTTRYQIRRTVNFTYNANRDPTVPQTKLALTTYINRQSGERWESREFTPFPYMPKSILGYVMTRNYPNSFPAYECYSYTTLDHFVGTADECFGTNIEALRVLGHMWSIRVANDSIAVYRCNANNDMFLSRDINCEGLAPPCTTPFGYIMDGPPIDPDVFNRDILVGQGQKWNYLFGSAPALQHTTSWTDLAYDNSRWMSGSAPFGSGYYNLAATYFGTFDYYFRQTFTIMPNRILERAVVSIASDDFAYVYINGVLIDSDDTTHHEAAYWNRQVFVPLHLINETGTNLIAVLTINYDIWAFFDAQIAVRYTEVPDAAA